MTDETQDTGEKQPNGRLMPPKASRFTKGDKRINRNGRPKSFDQLRKLAQRIAAEDISPAEAAEAITRVEAMLRVMSSSRNPADRALFLAYSYGKPKDEVDITSGNEKIKGYVIVSPDDWDKANDDKE
jgi:hypothetical protein